MCCNSSSSLSFSFTNLLLFSPHTSDTLDYSMLLSRFFFLKTFSSLGLPPSPPGNQQVASEVCSCHDDMEKNEQDANTKPDSAKIPEKNTGLDTLKTLDHRYRSSLNDQRQFFPSPNRDPVDFKSDYGVRVGLNVWRRGKKLSLVRKRRCLAKRNAKQKTTEAV